MTSDALVMDAEWNDGPSPTAVPPPKNATWQCGIALKSGDGMR